MLTMGAYVSFGPCSHQHEKENCGRGGSRRGRRMKKNENERLSENQASNERVKCKSFESPSMIFTTIFAGVFFMSFVLHRQMFLKQWQMERYGMKTTTNRTCKTSGKLSLWCFHLIFFQRYLYRPLFVSSLHLPLCLSHSASEIIALMLLRAQNSININICMVVVASVTDRSCRCALCNSGCLVQLRIKRKTACVDNISYIHEYVNLNMIKI